MTNPIKKLRKLAGLSQLQMAQQLGEKQPHISRYEAGKISISLDKFIEWCKILEINDYNTLFKDDKR